MRGFIVLIFCSIYWIGCSISGHYYLRNSSEKEVIVKMRLGKYADSTELDNLKYIEGIEKIKRSSFKKLKEGLMPFKIEGQDYFFKIPPKSFVNIGYGLNYHYRGLVKFIEIEGKKTDLSDWQIWSDLRVKYSGYVAYLEI